MSASSLRLLAVFALVMLLSPAGTFAQLSSLRYGTWTLNVSKSTFDPGPPPMSQTRKEELVGNAMSTSVEGVDAKGARISYRFVVPTDGKDHPVTGAGIPYGSDTIALTAIDPFTLDATFKKAGVVMGTARAIMSTDGKTLTVVSKGKNATGQPTNNVTVWDKN